MRIAFVSYWSCPLTRLGVLRAGGMNVYTLNFANELGKLGHSVDIYTKTHREKDEKILALHNNVRIIHLFSRSTNLYTDALLFADKILNFIKKNSLKYDILHSHYYLSGLTGIKLKNKLKIPLFNTFHTLSILKNKSGEQADLEREEAEKKIANESNGIISSTELEKEELIKNYKISAKKVFIVHPGVNHDVFKKIPRLKSRIKLSLPQKPKIILFVGRIDPIKGISLLIEAIYKLTKFHPDFEKRYRVILIGGDIKSPGFWSNREVLKIKSMIGEKNLDCCVKFIGSRPHYLLPYYYSSSDVVVMPSAYESFGFVVLEAMACGSTVLASKVGGLKLLIKDKINGRLFDSGDSSVLKDILWELLNDKEQRLRLGLNAILSSDQYCWDKQAKKMLSVYNEFI